MSVPVVLVAGFLGAGKTTVVNHLLAHAAGRRIAAVVNDFGEIDIDAELIAEGGGANGVMSLRNGCICCTLVGDLLRTLGVLLRREPRPEAIVIETSGVADPSGTVRSLMDPAIWREAPLDTVLCVVDATRPEVLDDPLGQAQVRAADVLAISKGDLAGADAVRPRLRALNPAAVVVDAPHGAIPSALLFSPDLVPALRKPGRLGPSAERFETLSWTADRPLRLSPFQAAMGRLAPRLARAKGVIAVEGQAQPLLLQLVGGRASLAPADLPGSPPVRLVFIAELGRLDRAAIEAELQPCLVDL